MLVVVVRSRALHLLASRAGEAARLPVRSAAAGEPAAHLRALLGERGLLIHDFAPDALRSIAWLEHACAAGTPFPVFALLETPATPVLDRLVRAARRVPLAGMALAAEETPHALAERLCEALEFGGQRALLELIVVAWRLDPLLASVAERALSAERPHATLSGALRDCGVGRKRFVRHARERGFAIPRRFLHGLRVLQGAALLQQGYTTRQVAARLGYGSLDTLRHHFREMLGLSPSGARRQPLPLLAQRVVTHRVD